MTWQFFRPLYKIQKDRKLLRTIDRELVQRSLRLLPSFLVFCTLIIISAQQFVSHVIYAVSFGVIITFIISLTFWYCCQFSEKYSQGPARWRQRFFILNGLVLFVLGVFFAAVYAIEKINQASFLLWVILAILSVWVMLLFAPFKRFFHVGLSLLLWPTIISLFFIGQHDGVLIAISLIIFYLFLLVFSGQLERLFWQSMKTSIQLSEKEAELKNSTEILAKLSKVKEDFLANMGHELKTPLNSLLGMLALLGDTSLSENQQKFLKVAQYSGDNLLELINDIFDFAQLSFQRISLNSHTFDLYKMLDDLFEVMGPYSHDHYVELSFEMDENVPRRLIGDPARLTQVLNNLLSNAIKFSEKSEVALLIHLKNRDCECCELLFEVIDQGVGLSLEQQSSLFTAFSKISSDDADHQKDGTGLGLAICREIVDIMQGEIGVKSQAGKGSNFWFTAKLGASTQQADSFKSCHGLVGKEVWLVGFRTFMVNGLFKQLEQWGVNVRVVSTGDGMLAVMKETITKPLNSMVILLNINLHNLDDLLLSEKFIECSKSFHLKQILVMGLVQRGEQKLFEYVENISGISCLAKPIRRDDLHQALLTAFEIEGAVKNREVLVDIPSEELHKHVLLVEDNKVSQLVSANMLRKLGCEVKIANNGKEALGMLGNQEFQCIFMDCQMPILNGYEAAKEIRRREKEGSHLPIIALTANALQGDEAKCLSCGMDGYVAKPVSLDLLSTALEKYIF